MTAIECEGPSQERQILQKIAKITKIFVFFPSEVFARESFDKIAAVAPFALTANGALDQLEITPTATADVNLFVARNAAASFYSVAVRMVEA